MKRLTAFRFEKGCNNSDKASIAFITAALLLFSAFLFAFKFPAPRGYVNDFAGVLGQDDIEKIDSLCTEVQQKTSAEITVVTVKDLEPYGTIEEYAEELFKAWGIGKKGKDNGVLILASMKEHKLRIEVGYGLEPVITDGIAGGIIRSKITPAFRDGQYGTGLYQAALAVAGRISGSMNIEIETVKKARQRNKVEDMLITYVFPISLFLVFFALPMFLPRKRSGRGFIGGFGGGFGGFGSGGGFGGGFGGFGGGGSGGGGASGGW